MSLRVDLQYDTISGHWQVFPFRVPVVDEIHDFLQGFHFFHALADLKAPFCSRHQILIMTITWQLLPQKIVEIGIELSACHQFRLLAFECAASRIAWIGEERFAGLLPLSVESFKHLPWHQYFAPDFKLRRNGRCGGKKVEPLLLLLPSGQHQWYGTDGLHIGCHIISLHAITPCHASHQLPVLVGQRDRQSIVFQFATHLKRFAGESFAYTAVPVGHILLVVGVGQ